MRLCVSNTYEYANSSEYDRRQAPPTDAQLSQSFSLLETLSFALLKPKSEPFSLSSSSLNLKRAYPKTHEGSKPLPGHPSGDESASHLLNDMCLAVGQDSNCTGYQVLLV